MILILGIVSWLEFKGVTFINCTIESLQGMCYIDNLIMKNCTLINTTLAFEYSNVNVDRNGKIDSVHLTQQLVL